MTLIELLVCLAVVIILGAILIPTISYTLESSRSASCTSNLRQIGVAVTLWSQEHGGAMPDSRLWQEGADNAFSIAPYLGLGVDESTSVATVLTCPSSANQSESERIYRRTYSMNRYAGSTFNGVVAPYTTLAPTKVTELLKLSERALFMDGVIRGSDTGLYFSYADQSHMNRNGGVHEQFPHRDGMNVLFADGHVERIEAEYAVSELSKPWLSTPFWSGL
ncbi:MAG: prepilin-type N-terminal cleavage/methylation domain-containing protein [Verrucomicrobiota bacterium JB024]|nr:prepilin-type N-terminal cleavage/methylation domain-containing protein [Verrucomicrobiota bacterium JB024]